MGSYKLLLLLKTVGENNLNYISNQPRNGSWLGKHGTKARHQHVGVDQRSQRAVNAGAESREACSDTHTHCCCWRSSVAFLLIASSSPSDVWPTFSISSCSHAPLMENA